MAWRVRPAWAKGLFAAGVEVTGVLGKPVRVGTTDATGRLVSPRTCLG